MWSFVHDTSPHNCLLNGLFGTLADTMVHDDASEAPRPSRRAPRGKPTPNTIFTVNGEPVDVVDISGLGAQVIAHHALRPNQRVRIVIRWHDEVNQLHFEGSIAWAQYELPPPGGACYRVGLEFLKADPEVLEQFCADRRTAEVKAASQRRHTLVQQQPRNPFATPTTARRPTLVE